MNPSHDIFREEAYELLDELEGALLALEEEKDDADLVGRVFRAMHTLKGSGGMFGFDDIAAFTHELETVFDLVREGRMAVTKELINLTLTAGDQIKRMLDESAGADGADEEVCQGLIQLLKQMVPENGRVEGELTADVPDLQDNDIDGSKREAQEMNYHIRFKPHADLFKTGTNPLLLLDELRQMGPCVVMAQTHAIPPLEEIDTETCYTAWEILLTTVKDMNAIRDVFIFVEDDCEIDIRIIGVSDTNETEQEIKRLGEILIERGDLNPADLDEALLEQPRIGQVLVNKKVVSKSAVEAALAEQAHIKQRHEQKSKALAASSIRVPSDKLDALVDLVGELVTVQASLSQKASTGEDPELTAISEKVERLTADLRDNTMGIRMMPIGTTFSKFKRLVRDLANELGKEVVLSTEGGETELDKTVLEQLNDPLVHIIRNSIDHGIEAPEARIQADKSEHGTVHLSAEHIGANVVIQITDDGAGLDAASIRESAIAKNILLPEAELSEKETFELIFAPGFSTAKTVTNVSGRGVGMDVVKKSIETLRGSIDVSSKKGIGTTISLELPLTLAIIEGFMVMIGDEHFVFPLTTVEECVKISGKELEDVHRRNIMNIRGAVVPYQNLREAFEINTTSSESERIVVVESGGQRMGFGVDNVIGQHQTVIKSLGKMYRDIKGISGATILGDGTVAMILDVAQLINSAERHP